MKARFPPTRSISEHRASSSIDLALKSAHRGLAILQPSAHLLLFRIIHIQGALAGRHSTNAQGRDAGEGLMS
jgi:hypothetical protein